MKQRKHGIGFVGVLLLLAACANGGDSSVGDGGGPDGSKPLDGSNKVDTGSMTCVPTCTSDSECQSSCPTPSQGGINCCDLTTNTCFATQNNVCGGGGPDGGQTD